LLDPSVIAIFDGVHVPRNDLNRIVSGGSTHSKVEPRPRVQLSDSRIRGRARAAQIVRVTTASTCGAAQLARSLGVTHTTVARWGDEEESAAMTLGDIFAGPRSFAVATLTAALSQLGVETNKEAIRTRVAELGHVVAGLQKELER
jgi:hypothetical protein